MKMIEKIVNVVVTVDVAGVVHRSREGIRPSKENTSTPEQHLHC